MSHNPQKTVDLLRDLVAAFVEKPNDLEIEVQRADDGSCYFAMQGAREDEPRLIGTAGSHVDALAFLVAIFGKAIGKVFTFRLITNGRPEHREKKPKIDVVWHDARPSGDILFRVLKDVGLEDFTVQTGPGKGPRDSLTFYFDIKVTAEDYKRLTIPPVPFGDGRHNETALIAAIGTLFRAIAMKSGVRYNLVATTNGR